MRMRKKKNLVPRMERCGDILISDPVSLRGQWREKLMPDARSLRVELGCGKGRFTAQTAAAEPDVLFIAIERVPDAMVVAMERCQAEGLGIVFFLDADAVLLPTFFASGEVDRLYINFCDPWPGIRQAKRRLTHGNFLRLYRQVLPLGGEIHFKSDNAPLFDFSVEEIPQFGFSLSEVTRNLHENGPRGVMTDYEAKFYELGTPINRCVATMETWTETPEVRHFRRSWLAHYGAGVPAETLEVRVTGEGNFLWHLFSFQLIPCLKGDAARSAFDALDYDEAYLFNNGDWNDAPYVRATVKRSAAQMETERDLFVVAKDLSWSYVHTHESACGPYFCQK